jgi:hypothetical protein
MTAPTTLPEPVNVAKFWRNRKGEAVIVQLREFEGRAIVDVRVNFTNAEGRLQPTRKGVAVVVHRLPELATAINKALSRAKELGLLNEKRRACTTPTENDQ